MQLPKLINYVKSHANRGGCGLIKSPPRLGLGTILGLLGQSLTHMGTCIKLWVRNLGTAWEGIRHPRPPNLWAGLHCVLVGHI